MVERGGREVGRRERDTPPPAYMPHVGVWRAALRLSAAAARTYVARMARRVGTCGTYPAQNPHADRASTAPGAGRA